MVPVIELKLRLALDFLNKEPNTENTEKPNLMRLLPYARLLSKLSSEDKFDQDDWVQVVQLAMLLASFLYEHSTVKVTPDSQQVHFQPLRKARRKK